jgi:tripartite motif-containing protein 2/3
LTRPFHVSVCQVGKKGSAKGSFNLISSVTVGPLGEIIVADSRIQVFSAKGDYLQELCPEGKGTIIVFEGIR